MTILPKSSSYESVAEPFHCDFHDRLFMGHLVNHMLNAADFHSTERGYGMRYLRSIGKTWVLSRLVVEMEEMPMAGSSFSIETWVESTMRYFTHRNFAVRAADGSRAYGYGRSIWAMIDTGTRQPTDIMAIHGGLINEYADPDKPCPIEPFRRVRLTNRLNVALDVQSGYSDVDLNGHINSVKYIEHSLDAIPIEYYRHNSLRRIDIAYMAECHGGDLLRIYREDISEREFGLSLRRIGHDGAETEACRCQLCF